MKKACLFHEVIAIYKGTSLVNITKKDKIMCALTESSNLKESTAVSLVYFQRIILNLIENYYKSHFSYLSTSW